MAIIDKNSETRAQPQSLEAEACTLGAILMDNKNISLVADRLKVAHFYSPANRLLYETMLSLYEKNKAIDLTTLINELTVINILEKAGGTGYIATLEDRVIYPTNILHYAQIVIDKAQKRELINSAYQILESSYNEEMDASELITYSEKLIFDLSQSDIAHDFVSIKDMMTPTLEDIQRRYSDKHEVTGLKTHYYELDNLTSGLQRSELIILAARPSKGKTSLALNIALNVAVHSGLPVGIFSLEMSSQLINHRLLSTLARVPMQHIRSGFLTHEDMNRISEYSELLSRSEIFIDDSPGMTMLELRAKARRLKSRVENLSLIIVDYIQLMHSGGKVENRQQEVAQISRSLKALARELEVPLLAISQLSRLIEHRSGQEKKPILSDLRESGAIEQDADLVIFIHPEEEEEEEEEEEKSEGEEEKETRRNKPPRVTEIIIGKQRNGPLGTRKLLFFPECTLFMNPPKRMRERPS